MFYFYRGAQRRKSGSRATDTGRSPANVVLYTRAGCHLCDDVKRLLETYQVQHAFSLAEIDIDDDAGLRARFDHCVPVVEIDGKVRFRGKVNDVLLRRMFR